MKSYILRLIILISFVAVAGAMKAADVSGLPLDQRLIDRLQLLVDEPRTGRLQKMTLGELEKIIQKITSFKRSGMGWAKTTVYTQFDYSLESNSDARSTLSLQILATGQGNKFEEYIPVNARLVYFAPSGVAYYHSILSTPWLCELK